MRSPLPPSAASTTNLRKLARRSESRKAGLRSTRASPRQTSSADGVSRGAAKLAFNVAEFAFISQSCLAQPLGSRCTASDPDFCLPSHERDTQSGVDLFKFEHRSF